MTNTPFKFYGIKEELVDADITPDGELKSGLIKTTVHHSPDFIDKVRAKREYQDSKRFSELTKGDELERIHVARITPDIINRWYREGFDIHEIMRDNPPQAAAQMILDRLRFEEQDHLLLTNRTF
jgi:hypothetical protein